MFLQLIGVPICAVVSLLPRVLQKIQVEQVEALIAPYWSTQPWFSQILSFGTSDLQIHCNKFVITTRSQSQTPISRNIVTDGGNIIRQKYRKLGHFISQLETRYTKIRHTKIRYPVENIQMLKGL